MGMDSTDRATGVKEERLKVKVSGVEHAFAVRTPAKLCADPALVINLANDLDSTFNQHPYCILSDVFLAAGHRAAAVDMPCHGGWVTKYGDGIIGIAAALAAGVDLYAELGRVGRAVIDACVERKLARPGHVVAGGTSRGGLGALHILAADERVIGVAMQAPCTHLAA